MDVVVGDGLNMQPWACEIISLSGVIATFTYASLFLQCSHNSKTLLEISDALRAINQCLKYFWKVV